MEERIKQLAEGLTGSVYDIAKQIQSTLLFDTNNHVPLGFIIGVLNE